jgi:hypothetical protein
MSPITKLFIGALVILLAVAAAAGQVLQVHEKAISHSVYTANTGEVTGNVLIGQTFVSDEANLSAVAVLFANYSNRRNTKPVEFQLRSFPEVGQIL